MRSRWRKGYLTVSLWKITRRIAIPRMPSSWGSRPALSARRVSGTRKPLQMMIGVAERLRDRGQPAERVADLQLLRHSHATVQLHGFLAHVPARIRDLDLGR